MALARPTQKAVPFANSGVKNVIPETATGSNLASLQEGFPTVTMTDVDQGGMPPQGQDINGILFDVTTAIRYQQAGGLFPYDATFAAAIDGYPLGAILTATDGSCLYQNTVSGNQTDPENGGTGWSQILSSASIAGKQDKLSPTQMDAVNSGITAARVAIYDGYAAGKQDTLTFDNVPTSGSTNPVTSDGLYTALGTKQDTITVDSVPTSGSTNPVQSGGVYDAVDGKVSKSGDTMTGALSVVANYGVNDANTSHIATTDFTMKRRSCYVGQNGNGVASPWFKVCTYTTTSATSTTAVCLFDVASTNYLYQRGGQLRVAFRLNANRVLNEDYTKLEWVTTYGDLNPDDFALVFNSDSSSITLDLYVRCNKADLRYAFKVLSEKTLLSGNSNAQAVFFNLANNVSNGSLASLPAGTQIKSQFKSKTKCAKRIVFTADKKFPDYDVLLTRMVQGGGVPAYIYPQAPAIFSKDGKDYLFVLQTPGGVTGTITSVTYAVTVYDLDTYEYLGCFLLPNSSLGQGIVVMTESGGDFIYTKNSSNELVKSQFSVSNLTGALDTSNIDSEIARVTLTPQVVKNSNNESIKYTSFLSRLNGKWLIDNTSARVSGDSQNAMLFLDDSFDVVGVFDIQKFEKDIFTGYENSDSSSWTIPKTQGISIGVDGVYMFKGSGTNAADTATALTDCGVDHYGFNGDLVRTSVCDHTLFAGRMLSLLGLTSSINHSESEGGFCTEDGRCFWFGVFAGHTGKIALLEEFSDAPDAVDFSDCMAVRRTNIPCRSNVPIFPKANGVRNPWTGDELTSLTEFVEMCAKYGIDDISLSCFGMTWQPKILNTTVWGSTSFVINLLRMHSGRYFAEIKGYSSYPKIFSIGLTDGAVSECVEVTQPSFVVESGTGYKRYSDGTQECWGSGNTSNPPASVNFPKAFSDVPIVTISGKTGSVDMQMRLYKVSDVSASSFTPVATNIGATAYSAVTYQYYARGTWSA